VWAPQGGDGQKPVLEFSTLPGVENVALAPSQGHQRPRRAARRRRRTTTFHTPSSQDDNRHAPANPPSIRHVGFAVEDIDAVVADLRARGAELVGELERYVDSYRLCYVRGPEGIIAELMEQMS
jgi:catechol 2,3-dioxygenase-like lactoylglutathione lyase family enzyme